jgi:transcriptional repressor of cell division inhibition gene dicB
MTKDEAVAHFGTQVLLARALGMSQGSVSLWGERPPEIRQLQIEALTGGKLKAGPECDKYRVPASSPETA